MGIFDSLKNLLSPQDDPKDSGFQPMPSLSESERQRIRSLAEKAGQIIARSWPLRSFVYRNPLQSFEHLPFDEAVRTGQGLFKGQGYLSNETYRSFYHTGRISEQAVRKALNRHPALEPKRVLRLGRRQIEAYDILRIHLIYGLEALDEASFHREAVWGNGVSQYRVDLPAVHRKKPEENHIASLWTSVLEVMGLPDPFSSHSLEEQAASPSSIQAREARKGDLFLEDLVSVGSSQTLGEWVQRLSGINILDRINDQMIKWSSAFLDEGMAAWQMPLRKRGFYSAWRNLAPYDGSLALLGIRNFSGKVRQLPEHPEDLIAGYFQKMGLTEDLWIGCLSRYLAQLPGWSGFIKWRSGEAAYPWQLQCPIDLVQYLAVRIFYEAELVELACRKTWGIPGHKDEIEAFFRSHPRAYPLPEKSPNCPLRRVRQDAWPLFNLAQFLGLSPEEIRASSQEEIQKTLDILRDFPAGCHGAVWLEAFEDSYKQSFLEKLSSAKSLSPAKPQGRPHAQAVFCIDARSEALRRHLEDQGNYETYGFAGFFGVPICYRPYGSDEELLLCPALIKPERVITEAPKSGQEKQSEHHKNRSLWHHLGHGLFHDLKGNNFSAYFLIDLLSGLFGLRFIGKTLFPRAYQRLREKLRTALEPSVATYPMIDRPTPKEGSGEEEAPLGFTLTEQAAFVENGLRLIGLPQNFARLILLCAHGGTAENNPYSAAYDCGACGGSPGGPNARVLRDMANKPSIRAKLLERGIKIPEDTLFLAAEHNTTTDRVVLFDLDEVPPSHREEAARLSSDLHQAGMLTALERIKRLPGTPKTDSLQKAYHHVEARSLDWSQTRPEWGLSSNTAFIVGRRTLTQGLDLAGRVFMHSYDPKQDTSGKLLEVIMTAPMLVVQWISMDYYFSSADPWNYGSGNKVLHNVVGGIGVMLGRQSDLKPGLPMQSVMDANTRYHEPMRPLVIIESPPERVLEIIERHTVLQHLFNNAWVKLILWDPALAAFQEYQPGGLWEPACPSLAEAR